MFRQSLVLGLGAAARFDELAPDYEDHGHDDGTLLTVAVRAALELEAVGGGLPEDETPQKTASMETICVTRIASSRRA